MASSQLQNIQRGVIFLQATSLLLIGILLLVKLVKKRIDIRHRQGEEVQMDSAAQKYKEKPENKDSIEQTEHKFEETVVKDTVLTDDDNCTERFMKKICEYNTNFYPLTMAFVVSVVIGRSYAFQLTVYLLGLVFCMCFNVFKVHRACVDFMFGRWLIQILFPVCCLFLIIGLVVSAHTTMLYKISEA